MQIVVQPTLGIEVLTGKTEVVLYCRDRDRCISKGVIGGGPDNRAACGDNLLWGSLVIVLIPVIIPSYLLE